MPAEVDPIAVIGRALQHPCVSDLPPTFDNSEQAALDEIGRRLRAQGWAEHVTVARLLSDWRALASSVDRYRLTIDDYTNDLVSRDGLELVLAACTPPLLDRLRPWDAADREFTERTDADPDEAIGRFYHRDDLSGWWWKRRPSSGPLADYLAEAF